MADRATTVPTPAAAAEGVPNLHKDEVTGEMVSKSELKKRQKKREADAKKVCFLFHAGGTKTWKGGGIFFSDSEGIG